MNYKIAFCALLLAVSMRAHAEALDKRHVSADAKWLVHLDLENLRQTTVGDYLFQQVLAPHIAQMGSEFKLNPTNILQRISSITAYGTDFKKGADSPGVLMINSDADTQKALEGILVAQILANTNGPVKKMPGDGLALYSFGNQVFISPQKGGPIVVSKSQAQIESARELLAGQGESLASSKTFAEYPAVANSFFFVGLADALNLPNAIPAQAKILQMADGGRIALGEKNEQVFLNLALRGKSAEVTRQIAQVVEGMLALVALGQPENQELTDLAKSTKVSSTDQLITISMECPASKLVAKLKDQMAPKQQQEKVQKTRTKMKHKREAKPDPANEKAEAEEKSDDSK